jgi:4-amino-4-deoxy-L-arabinose transferase-like glycosyltransferase
LVALLAGTLTFWGLTRSGYANTYYAEAAQAASHSWRAWLTNAIDTSGSDSLDKGPLSNMVMGLSGRLLGFSSFSMLLPEALCGVGSVLLLHNTVKRTLGHRTAVLAALILALTPIFVAMSRFNNPDALLVLLEVAAAWALVRALQSGRTVHVLLCGVFVGLAFNVKMLQAYLIVPGLAMTFVMAGRRSPRRRVIQLLGGGVSMFAVSFAWYGAMMLLPAADRPWVGDTTDNSWFSLIFGANGLSRVSGEGTGAGPGAGGGFGGAAGPLRLFNSVVGGQIAWMLPLALLGLALGLWTRRRSARSDLARSAYLLWGGWAAVSWAVFSFSKGIFHPYYTTALAPAVAALAASGLVIMWERSRASTAWSVLLAASFIAGVALALALLDRVSGFVPFLAPILIVLVVLSSAALLLGRLRAVGSISTRGRIAVGGATAGLAALLAGPAAYSIATVGKGLDGGNPLAGPASADISSGGGPGGGARAGAFPRPRGPAPGALPGAPAAGARVEGLLGAGSPAEAGVGVGRPPAFPRGPGGNGRAGFAPAGRGSVSKTLVRYLEAHQRGATYLVAAVGSSTAASISLQSNRNVIDMGGFMGSDPAPSLARLKRFIASGQLRYVLLSNDPQGRAPGGAQQAASAATRTRDAWIRAHGAVVHNAGTGSTGAGTLYYFATRE